MKVFVYSTHILNFTPHHETELEIIQKHLDNGDEVIRLVCNGDLSICDLNLNHELLSCLKCRDYRICGSKLISPGFESIPMIIDSLKIPKFDLSFCKEMKDLKKIYYHNFDIGYAIASSLISLSRDSEFDLVKGRSMVDRYYESSMKLYLSCKERIREYMPDKVYLFNGRLAHVRAIMRACESENTNFVIHERGYDKDHYRIVQNDFHLNSSFITKEVNDYWIKSTIAVSERNEIGANFYQQRKLGNTTEWISYTKDQQSDLLPVDFDRGKRNIAIFNSSCDEFSAVDQNYEYVFFDNQEELIRQLCINFENEPDFHFYLRIHPNLKGLKNAQTSRLAALNFKNLTIISAESKVSSYNLIDACEKVLTFGSTIGLEAVFWSKPAICVAHNYYSGSDSSYDADNHLELGRLVREFLSPKNRDEVIKYGYYFSSYGFAYVYYKAMTLFQGEFKGVDLHDSTTMLSKVLTKAYSIKYIGKPIDLYAKLYKRLKLKLPFFIC